MRCAAAPNASPASCDLVRENNETIKQAQPQTRQIKPQGPGFMAGY